MREEMRKKDRQTDTQTEVEKNAQNIAGYDENHLPVNWYEIKQGMPETIYY